MKHFLSAVGAVCLLLAVTTAPSSVGAQTPGAGDAPDSFNVDIAATPLQIDISAPAVLPLDVNAGIAYSQVGLNSQPRIQSTAGPVFVPLLSDVGLLGGPAGVLATVVRLTPGLVVGIPTLFGLDPIPADPTIVDVGPLATLVNGLPLPALPPLGCTSYYPDVPNEVECGGPVQEFFGFRLGAGSARTTSTGKEGEPSSLASRSDASVTGISPVSSNTLTPLSAGSVASTAESKVVEGRITAAASAQASKLTVAGGLTVASVNARFAAAMGGTNETLQQSPLRCEIGAISLAGQSIALNEEGLTLGPTDIPGDPLGTILGPLSEALGGQSGQVGDADFGSVTITPNPRPSSVVSPDGTQITHRFGCLEIRYRNRTSGTDVTYTIGAIAVTMSAFLDAPFSGDGELTTDVPDLDGPGSGDQGALADLGAEDLALPEIPAPGSGAPAPSERPFLDASDTLQASWGIDGGWFAPYALLALCLPVLVRYRRLAIGPIHRPGRS